MFDWLKRAPPPPPAEQESHLEKHLRLMEALTGYSVYAPPEPDPNPDIPAASAAYREYFLGSMQTRLEGLRAFLANFDVSLSSDDEGLMAVSAWLPQWGDLLVDEFKDEAVRNAYQRIDVPWTGTLIGLNVIFDLGVYYAACLWARRTKLEWHIFRQPEGTSHFVQGLPSGRFFDPIDFTYRECWNIRNIKIANQKRPPHPFEDPWILKSDRFCRHVLANAPPGRRSRKSEHR